MSQHDCKREERKPHTTISSHSVPRACSRQLARSEELESPQSHPSFDFEVLPLYLQAFLFSFVQHGPKMCVLVRCRLDLVAPRTRAEEIVDRLADKLSFFEWLGLVCGGRIGSSSFRTSRGRGNSDG